MARPKTNPVAAPLQPQMRPSSIRSSNTPISIALVLICIALGIQTFLFAMTSRRSDTQTSLHHMQDTITTRLANLEAQINTLDKERQISITQQNKNIDALRAQVEQITQDKHNLIRAIEDMKKQLADSHANTHKFIDRQLETLRNEYAKNITDVIKGSEIQHSRLRDEFKRIVRLLEELKMKESEAHKTNGDSASENAAIGNKARN